MIVRCLAIIAFALAFALPYIPFVSKNPDTATVLLWDNSFSMQASPYAGFLERKAVKIITGCNNSNPLLIGMVNKKTKWSNNFSGDKNDLLSFYEMNKNRKDTSLFENAIRLADLRLKSIPAKKKKIIIITDEQVLPWKNVNFKNKLYPGVKLEIITPENPGFKNVAVTKAKLIEPFNSPTQKLTLRVNINNYTADRYDGYLSLKYNNEKKSRHIFINPGEKNYIFSFVANCKTAFPISVNLDIDDDIKIDNEYFSIIKPAEKETIFFTDINKEKINYVNEVFNPENNNINCLHFNNNTTSNDLEKASLLIIQKHIPKNSKTLNIIHDYILHGGTVVVLWSDNQQIKDFLLKYKVESSPISCHSPQQFEEIDFSHPIMNIFNKTKIANLFSIIFFNSPKLTLPDNSRIIFKYSNGYPAIAEIYASKGKLFVIAAEPKSENSNWQTDISFLPFWHELLKYSKKDKNEKTENKLLIDESKSMLLSKSIRPDRLTSEKETDKNYTVNKILSNEKNKSFWKIILLAGFLCAFIELAISNRTAL